ncbi:type II toxin-antitoxin system HicB family antitoxin [Vibrio lentus]|nr:type II toxin-antitoxin system HicB family antitoxin [Vibrio lentus]
MLYPIAIETGDKDFAYGVVFPDLPNCFSAGDTLDEALSNAKEAVDFYLEDLAVRGKLPPIDI